MAAPAFEALRYEVKDHIATITLNRPDQLNSFNGQMAQELRAVWDVTDRDDDVRCVIVTGEGRAFCAGADLSGGNAFRARDGDAASTKVNRDGAGLVTLRIFESLKLREPEAGDRRREWRGGWRWAHDDLANGYPHRVNRCALRDGVHAARDRSRGRVILLHAAARRRLDDVGMVLFRPRVSGGGST
jgi:hypothetical protein